MESQLHDLKNWCDEIVIKFNQDYKWTGLAIYKDGFSTNWQGDSLQDIIQYLWDTGYDRRIRNKNFVWPIQSNLSPRKK